MSKSVLFFAIILSILISGCSSNKYKPPEYRDFYSKARNIMFSGEMHTGFYDTRIPKEEYDSLTLKVLEGSAVAYAGTGAALTALNGLLNWQSAALNLLFWSVAPKEHSARNSIVAFLPQHIAKDEIEARNLLRSKLADAFSAVIKENGGNVLHRETMNEGRFESIVFSHKEWNCSYGDQDICNISINLIKPKTGLAPSFISEDNAKEQLVYAFTSKDRFDYNYFKFQSYNQKKGKLKEGKTGKVPQERILLEVSKLMNEWVYLYAAPGKTYLANEKVNRVPMIFAENKIEYFILPKKS